MMMLQSSRLGFLPFWDALAGFVASLYNSTAIRHAPSYSGHLLNNDETDAKAIEVDVEGIDPLLDWPLWSLDYLLDTTTRHHARAGDPALPRVRDASAPSSLRRSHPKQRKQQASSRRRRRSRRPVQASGDGSFLARHEPYVTYAAVVATLQLFLHLARADATALLLPMLSRVTTRCRAREAGVAVLALVNAAGVLGSAFATRRYGRDATCAVSGALIVLCQNAVPTMMGAHAGLGGTRSASTGHAAAMFAAACAVSCGLSWAWGALFWAAPGPGEGGVRSIAGAALGLAQMQSSLLALRQLRHAALAYYAVRIWS